MAGIRLGDEDELKLLGTWASPWVSRVKLALNLKGLSYEYIEQDLDEKSVLLLASNPVHKKVPVLIHNGKSFCESRVTYMKKLLRQEKDGVKKYHLVNWEYVCQPQDMGGLVSWA